MWRDLITEPIKTVYLKVRCLHDMMAKQNIWTCRCNSILMFYIESYSTETKAYVEMGLSVTLHDLYLVEFLHF